MRNSHNQKKTGIFFLVIVLVIGGVVGSLLKIKSSIFWSLDKINFLAIDNQSITGISISKDDFQIIEFLGDEKVDLPRGFGNYELKKIYHLGELENKGGQLTLETFQTTLNLPVLGYFYNKNNFKAPEVLTSKDVIKMVTGAFKKHYPTNFRPSDLVVLYYKLLKSQNISVDKNVFDQNITLTLFNDLQVRNEALAIEILNGTEHPGLAQNASKLWENLGGRVIRVGDSEIKQSKTICGFSEKSLAQSYSLKLVKLFFNPTEVSFLEKDKRADITLVIGEDYWKMLTEKW